MHVRNCFVSNSSSASFIVEVKGEKENIFRALYENIETFQEDSYKELLAEAIKWQEKKLDREGIEQAEIIRLERTIFMYRDTLKNLEEYKKPDLSGIKDEKEKYFALWKIKNHEREVILGVISSRRWLYFVLSFYHYIQWLGKYFYA